MSPMPPNPSRKGPDDVHGAEGPCPWNGEDYITQLGKQLTYTGTIPPVVDILPGRVRCDRLLHPVIQKPCYGVLCIGLIVSCPLIIRRDIHFLDHIHCLCYTSNYNLIHLWGTSFSWIVFSWGERTLPRGYRILLW
jgi:hypothetical protein